MYVTRHFVRKDINDSTDRLSISENLTIGTKSSFYYISAKGYTCLVNVWRISVDTKRF